MNFATTVLFLVMSFCMDICTAYADELPFCSNRVVNEVTARTGCTLGDSRCWLTKGGFCTDYVLKKLNPAPSDREKITWASVWPEDVRMGDIAAFSASAHYAYVESVVRDKSGKAVAVNVSEFNFGTCVVESQPLVTNNYKKVNKRSNIPLSAVDGGFLRSSRQVP